MNEWKGLRVKLFRNQNEFADWLKKEGETSKSIWLQFAKKGTGAVSITYDEALDVALCYGWIDGLANSFDKTYYLLKFSPRGPKSMWSKRNVEIVGRLIKEKKMQPAGFAVIEAAKKDGRWDDAYESPKNMHVPDDFLRELQKHKKAYEFYQTLSRTYTYSIAFQLLTAKKPETRDARFNKILEMLKKGEKPR